MNINKRIRIGDKHVFAPVVMTANGRVKPDYVLIGGKPEKHTKGRYYIDWTEGGRRKRKSVGTDAAFALAAKLRKSAEIAATGHGVLIVPQSELDKRRRIDTAVSDYLDEVAMGKKKKTHQAYSVALAYFQESCDKTYLEEIKRLDLLKFSAFLRDSKAQSPRSVANKWDNLLTFLKAQKITGLARKGDAPVFTEQDVEIYEREDLGRFFKACDSAELLLFQFFLMSGFREQEVMHCTWSQINLQHNTVSMKWNAEYSWSPKAYRERKVPVPTKLIEALTAAKPAKVSPRALVFSTESGKRKFDCLDVCKRVAKKAGMDPADWFLHKFRATFCTMHLQNGVDLSTLQKWAGHRDLASTTRYLKAARHDSVRAKVDATFS
jgi:integrase/recombinase XerD